MIEYEKFHFLKKWNFFYLDKIVMLFMSLMYWSVTDGMNV